MYSAEVRNLIEHQRSICVDMVYFSINMFVIYFNTLCKRWLVSLGGKSNDLRTHISQKSVRIRFNSEPTRFYRELKTIGNFYVYKMGKWHARPLLFNASQNKHLDITLKAGGGFIWE